MWDPTVYLQHADHRARPFFDLMARVPVAAPGRVVDLGCGPGGLTRQLADRWPSADVLGVDSSPEMIERAAAYALEGRCRFVVGDVRDWAADGPVDLIVSNATLQWVPGHLDLLPKWFESLTPGGALAIQVPDNFDAPSHVLMRQLASEEPWADRLRGVLRHGDAVHDVGTYLDVLAGAGGLVDAWQTTYQHVLSGSDPVLGWVRGTGLRPVLAALGADAPALEEEYATRLRAAYPAASYGTVFPFRRTFVVATKPGGVAEVPA
jgi:trans-aconitate 2-methyltransferase